MPDVATVLREEIRRLARSEVKKQTSVLKQSAVKHRHELAQLKRDLGEARRRINVLESQQTRQRARVVESLDTDSHRFSAKGLRSHRKKLGLSAADYGKLLGVTGKTVYLWEQGKARPRGKTFASLVEVRKLGKRAALARLDS